MMAGWEKREEKERMTDRGEKRHTYIDYTEQSTRELSGSVRVRGQCTTMGSAKPVDDTERQRGGEKEAKKPTWERRRKKCIKA